MWRPCRGTCRTRRVGLYIGAGSAWQRPRVPRPRQALPALPLGLWAYPMVQGVDGQPTPLRVAGKVQLLVHAPPDTWGWGLAPLEVRPTYAYTKEAVPQVYNEAWYAYTKEESDRMWMKSTSYQGSPPLGQ